MRVVVAGDKAKGPAELFDAQNVKTEQWWVKKFSPSLVKTRSVTLRPYCCMCIDTFAQ